LRKIYFRFRTWL